MDTSGHSEEPGPGRRPSSPCSGTLMGARGQAAQSDQRSKVKITPFHSSPIASSDGALHSRRPGAACGRPLTSHSRAALFLETPCRLIAPPLRGRLSTAYTAAAAAAAAAAAGGPEEHTPSSGSVIATPGDKTQASPLVVKDIQIRYGECYAFQCKVFRIIYFKFQPQVLCLSCKCSVNMREHGAWVCMHRL